jgi:ATP-dependent RNA helicase DDX52/ROK1
VESTDRELPAELDFFKYAQGVPSKRKASAARGVKDSNEGELKGKKRKMDNEDVGETQDDKEDAPLMQRHRVTTKGSNVPQPIYSFGELKDRYHISSHLLSNLAKNGYSTPTGVQSYGIPILLEVCLSCNQVFRSY